jgi:serine/threonine protein kinase
MAPEVINVTMSYGIAADIWSLGCTVLEMVMGKPPLSDLEWPEVLWKVGHGEAPPIPENLSCDLKDFVKQCLEVDVKRRPTVDMLLTHPLVCSEPISGPFKLVAMTELSTIAEGKSFHSSKTGPSNATNREVKNHINGHGSKVVRGRLGRSMRTIRSELSSSTFCGIPL